MPGFSGNNPSQTFLFLGFFNGRGLRNTQCQYPGSADLLLEFLTQSTISTTPITHPVGKSSGTSFFSRTKDLFMVLEACIATVPTYRVRWLLFSTSFLP